MGLVNVQLVDAKWHLILPTGEVNVSLATVKKMGLINAKLVDAKWHLILYTEKVNLFPNNLSVNGSNKCSIGGCKIFVHWGSLLFPS